MIEVSILNFSGKRVANFRYVSFSEAVKCFELLSIATSDYTVTIHAEK